MAYTDENGMEIVTRSIEFANEAGISSDRELVQCLSSMSKLVSEHDKGGYLTTTLFTFLLQGPPRRPNPMSNHFPEKVAAGESDRSKFHVKKLLGLLGLILLHKKCMSLPPLPNFAVDRLDGVAILLRCLGIIIPKADKVLVSLLLNLLIEGNIYDKLISLMALGAIARISGDVERVVEAGVGVEFAKILKQGPMVLQAEVAYLISKFMAIDPTIQNKLPLHDLVNSLVSHLQLIAEEEHFQDEMIMTTSIFSVGAASQNSKNIRMIADDQNEKSPEVKTRMIATVSKTLRVLVNNDPSLCWIVVEGLKDVAFSLCCLGIGEEILTTECRDQVSLLLIFFRGSSLYDKWISLLALGVIAQETRKVEHLLAAGVLVLFSEILKEGPMLLQAEVAYVMSKCIAIDPTFRDKLPLDDLITSLVTLLQVELAEEHLQDDINKATSVLSIVAARHNSNKKKVADDRNEKSMSGEQSQLQHENPPRIKARMKVMAAKILGALAKDDAPACQIIVEQRVLLRFAVLLQNERFDVKLSSAMALMEITAVAEKETELRRSAFKHNSYARQIVVDQLMRIIEESLGVQSVKQRSSTTELLIPCIKAIGNLATTFRGTQPIISLVHLLESSNYEVVKESLAALTKFACRDHNFLHLDHSKEIVSLGGVNCLLRLAAYEDIGVQKHALVLLCYVAIDTLGNESDELKKVVSAINLASRKGHFSKDEAAKALLQQTKRRLSQLMLA